LRVAGSGDVDSFSQPCSVKFHKTDGPPTQTATALLETPMANPVDKEEDALHKRD